MRSAVTGQIRDAGCMGPTFANRRVGRPLSGAHIKHKVPRLQTGKVKIPTLASRNKREDGIGGFPRRQDGAAGLASNIPILNFAKNAKCRMGTWLPAIDLVVLRGSDLPLTIALQPGISPDLALLCVRMRFVFADGVLAAVNDCHIFAEKTDLGIVECATVRLVWALFIAELIRLVVALAASAGALEIVSQQL